MAGRLVATILEKLEAPTTFADEVDEDALFKVGRFQSFFEFSDVRDFLPVQVSDDVTRPDAFQFGDAAGFDLGDDDTFGQFHLELFGEVPGQRLDLEAEESRFRRLAGFAAVDDRSAFVRQFARLDLDLDLPVTADDVERHALTERLDANLDLQLLDRRRRFAIHRGDDVGGFQIRACRRAVPQDAIDDHAFPGPADKRFVFLRVAQVFDADAQPRASELAFLDQLVCDLFGQVGRDCETDTGAHAANERVDADDFAVNVHQRSAAEIGRASCRERV